MSVGFHALTIVSSVRTELKYKLCRGGCWDPRQGQQLTICATHSAGGSRTGDTALPDPCTAQLNLCAPGSARSAQGLGSLPLADITSGGSIEPEMGLTTSAGVLGASQVWQRASFMLLRPHGGDLEGSAGSEPPPARL
jgi:hypothetical protein